MGLWTTYGIPIRLFKLTVTLAELPVSQKLLQSHMGFIQLLPALPDAWKEGSVKGLCAKGNFEINITWQDGKLKEAVILSKAGEPCNLRYGNRTFTFKTTKGKKYKIMVENEKLKKIPL